ncbi:DUF7686 domain-containing protein [Paraburkholderia phymatum]|uniref:DUF7686 domain-containing protein n=1 Tax=Paraburkholderia phymatum TaxID=148447 RepID=UPI003D1876B5
MASIALDRCLRGLRRDLLSASRYSNQARFRREVQAGYWFQLISEADEDVFAQFGRLVEKMRRALRHIDFHERQIIDSTARGPIEWDESCSYDTSSGRHARAYACTSCLRGLSRRMRTATLRAFVSPDRVTGKMNRTENRGGWLV